MQSENAYKVQSNKKNLDRQEMIERQVRSLLNKIAPDNLQQIVEKMADIQLSKHHELEYVINLIYSKALDEDHYCETYADMIFALKNRYPEFAGEEGGKKNSFTRDLLNICQSEFENIQDNFKPLTQEEKDKFVSENDLAIYIIKRKKR